MLCSPHGVPMIVEYLRDDVGKIVDGGKDPRMIIRDR